MKNLFKLYLLLFPLLGFSVNPNSYVVFKSIKNSFCIASKKQLLPILVSVENYKGVIRVANDLLLGIERVTGRKTNIVNDISTQNQLILVGTIGKNKWIDELIKNKKFNVDRSRNFKATY